MTRPAALTLRAACSAVLLGAAAALVHQRHDGAPQGSTAAKHVIFARSSQSASKGDVFDSENCMAPLSGAEGTSAAASAQGLELAQVQVVMRHGARSTLHHINAQTNDYEFSCDILPQNYDLVRHWPSYFKIVDGAGSERYEGPMLLVPRTRESSTLCADGQLLNQGIEQQVKFGEYLRNKYNTSGFLAGLSTDNLYIRSTYLHRTAGSAAAMVSGLLGPELQSAISEHGHLHITTNPRNSDSLFGMQCPRAWDLLQKQDKITRETVPRPSVSNATMQLLHSDDVVGIADDLIQTHCAGGELPCGPGGCVNASLAKEIEDDANKYWCMTYGGEKGGLAAYRLMYQPFVTEILKNFQEKAQGKGPKFMVYSGHDVTIAPLAAALGFFTGEDCRWPSIASHIVFELWTPKKGAAGGVVPQIRVLYNGEVVTNKIAGCNGELCPLVTFAMYSSRLLEQFLTFEDACGAKLTGFDMRHLPGMGIRSSAHRMASCLLMPLLTVLALIAS